MKDLKQLEKLKYPIGHFSKPEIISEEVIQEWIKTIAFFSSKLKSIIEPLSISELNWRYRPEGWTIKQVIHHCADSHVNSFIRFKLALTEDNPTIKPYEENLWATLQDGNSDDVSDSIAIITGIHNKWHLLLTSFSDKEFSKTFFHPASNKNYALNEALGLYAWHCNHHLAHIQQAVSNKGQF